MIAHSLKTLAVSGGPCTPTGGEFFGFPKWYQYLDGVQQLDQNGNLISCDVAISSFGDVWKVAAAVLEILLRFGAILAVIFIIWGAFTMMMSQGEPDRIRQGKGTVINAVIGLVITILAAILVSILARGIT